MKHALLTSLMVSSLFFVMSQAHAAEPVTDQERVQVQKQEPIYGSQLMTRKERTDFRTKMRAANTVEEREQIRKEHHEAMQERAKERGVSIPDNPPAKGGKMEYGNRKGAGGGKHSGGGRAR